MTVSTAYTTRSSQEFKQPLTHGPHFRPNACWVLRSHILQRYRRSIHSRIIKWIVVIVKILEFVFVNRKRVSKLDYLPLQSDCCMTSARAFVVHSLCHRPSPTQLFPSSLTCSSPSPVLHFGICAGSSSLSAAPASCLQKLFFPHAFLFSSSPQPMSCCLYYLLGESYTPTRQSSVHALAS